MNLREMGCEDWRWMELAQDDGLGISGVQPSHSGTTLLVSQPISQSFRCNHRVAANSQRISPCFRDLIFQLHTTGMHEHTHTEMFVT
jgi:hypothetical protein